MKSKKDRKKVKLLFGGYTVLCIEDSKSPTKRFVDLIINFSSIPGYTVNTQKSVGYLYTTNSLREKLGKLHSPK